jgi:hypothetical protein
MDKDGGAILSTGNSTLPPIFYITSAFLKNELAPANGTFGISRTQSEEIPVGARQARVAMSFYFFGEGLSCGSFVDNLELKVSNFQSEVVEGGGHVFPVSAYIGIGIGGFGKYYPLNL